MRSCYGLLCNCIIGGVIRHASYAVVWAIIVGGIKMSLQNVLDPSPSAGAGADWLGSWAPWALSHCGWRPPKQAVHVNGDRAGVQVTRDNSLDPVSYYTEQNHFFKISEKKTCCTFESQYMHCFDKVLRWNVTPQTITLRLLTEKSHQHHNRLFQKWTFPRPFLQFCCI